MVKKTSLSKKVQKHDTDDIMRLVVIRHGYGCHNAKYSPSIVDPPLTEYGEEYSTKAGGLIKKKLDEMGINIDLIGSSPAYRAIQTAYYTNVSFGKKKIYVFPHLRELDEDIFDMPTHKKNQKFEEKSREKLDEQESPALNLISIRQQKARDLNISSDVDFSYVENDMEGRSAPGDITDFYKWFLQQKELEQYKNILVVAHAGVMLDFMKQVKVKFYKKGEEFSKAKKNKYLELGSRFDWRDFDNNGGFIIKYDKKKSDFIIDIDDQPEIIEVTPTELSTSKLSKEVCKKYSSVQKGGNARPTSTSPPTPTPTIIQLIRAYDPKKKETDRNLTSYIFKNPGAVIDLYHHMPVYSVAAIAGLSCLQVVHRAYAYKSGNLRVQTLPWEVRGSGGRTVLHDTIHINLYPQFDYLITRVKADVNTTDAYKNSPLHLTSAMNRKDMTRLLLQQPDINLNSINTHFETPLSLAVSMNHVEIAKALMSAGAMTKYRLGNQLFDLDIYVAQHGSEPMKTAFVQNAIRVKRQTTSRWREFYLKNLIREYSSDYVRLCGRLEATPIDDLKLLSKKLKVTFGPDVTHTELCSKISNKLAILKSNPKLLGSF
jgi:broad specificity phosphatase PhoE